MATPRTREPTADVRPIRVADAAAARAVVAAAAHGTPYATRMLALVDEALAGGDETRGLLVERGGAKRGVAIYGVVAGALGAARLHFVVEVPGPHEDDATASLLRAVSADAAAAGARFLLAELPDDPAVAAQLDALRRGGFAEEGRVADFFRDGVDLLLLRLPLRGGSA